MEGDGCWGLGWRLNRCLDSAVGANAVKLLNPEEQGISSAGVNCRSRGALGACCPRPQYHAAGLPGTAVFPTIPSPPLKLALGTA